ncbi:hypothetical protein Tco_0419759 [Tanacetum coccineum]
MKVEWWLVEFEGGGGGVGCSRSGDGRDGDEGDGVGDVVMAACDEGGGVDGGCWGGFVVERVMTVIW